MLPATALGVSSVQWNWSDNSYNESGFNLRRTSDNGAIVLSLAANTTFYRQTGLTPNAPQQAYAQAFNPAISTNSGNSTVVYTLANPPTGTAVTLRSSNTVTLAWNANGNPAGTEYRLQGATSVPLLALASFSTTTATSFSFNTLTADTTWFFRVRARNGGGVDTAFDATVSTLTLPAPPAAPSAPDVVARSTGSLTWGWTDLAVNEAGFRVRRASDTVVLVGTLPANSTQWLQTGLTPNAPQRVFAESFNVTASSASGFSPTRYTLAAAPTASTVAVVAPQTARFSWSANGNPAGTAYQISFAQSGFDPSFVPTTGTVRDFPGLTPNTTYEFQVSAQNTEGIFSAPGALLTLWIPPLAPNAPSAVAAVAFSTDSVSWSWTDNANNEDGFRVRRSSDNANLSGDLPVNSTGFVHAGLGPNAPARVRVEAFNVTAASASAPSATAYSLAVPPSALAFLGVFQSSVAFAWSAGGNPAGTLFRAERSLNGVAYVEIATTTLTNVLASSLTPDTTYFFRVRAENTAGTTTAYSNVITTRTIPLAPAVPTGFAAIARTTGTLTWGWADVSNEAGYRVRRSSDNGFVSGDLPSNTVSFTQTSLGVNTPQQLYVEAFNAGGSAPSAPAAAHTLSNPPAAPVVATAGTSTVSLTWAANGNPAGTAYEAEQSLNGVAYVNFYSGAASSATASGLTEGTTYFFRVRSLNGDGLPSAYSAAVSTRTTFAPPAGALAAPTAVAATTETLTWIWSDSVSGENGYRVMDAPGVTNLSGDLPAGTTTWTQTGLTPNVGRQTLVRAFNNGGTVSSPASGLFYTAANPPIALSGAAGQTTVALSWGTNGNPAGTLFRYERSLNGVAYAEFGSTVLSTATASGLTPDTTYFFRVRAENASGSPTTYSNVMTTRTIPLAPLAPTLFVIDESTVSIAWGWTDNADNETGYRLRRTTDNASLSGDLPAGTASFLQTGLTPNQSQRVYVEAFNAGGTGASGSLAHFTDAARPDVPAAAPTVSTVLLTWPANGNPPGTVYESQFGPSVETYGATLASTATARLFTGLAENTTYFFRVRAVNGDGNPTGYAAVSARTALGMPAAPSTPVVIDRSTGSLKWGWTDNATNEASYRFFARIGASDEDLSGALAPNTTYYTDTNFPTANAPRRAFVRASNGTGDADSSLSPVAYTLANPPTGSAVTVYVSSVTLRWNANGNAAGTVYRAEKAFGAGAFEEFQSGSVLEAIAVGLATGTYRFRVRAENGEAQLTAYEAVVQASVTVPNVFSVCSDGGAFSYGAANVIVPPGSASCGTVFTVVDPGTFPPGSGPAGTLKPLGVGADISAVPPVCGFSITLSYRDADVAGLDESTLVIARYDGARGFWIPLPSRVDPTTNKVTAAQACTSLVQVMGRAPSNNVSEGVAYPVPARTQITFSNLPASARIQIYTVSAEKVRELDADSGGQVVWDLRNESGETVASGTYLARIEKSGQDDVVKVVVQR